jgi:hypothetical protein
VEEGTKGVEIIDRLNKHYGRDSLQRTQVYYWIKEVKFGSMDLSNIPPPAKAQDDGLDDCIGKAFKKDPHLSTRRTAKALNISSRTVRNHLAKSLGMKWYDLRWVPYELTAIQKAKRREMAGSML